MNLTAGMQIPVRLGKEPLMEAAWELRFDGDATAGSLLPGVLYEKYRNEFPDLKMAILPASAIPAEARATQPPFTNLPTHALKFGNYTLFVGDQVVALTVTRPYPGWQKFKPRIVELATWLRELRPVGRPRQMAVRYTDFFAGADELLGKIQLNASLGDWRPSSRGLQLQMGINLGPLSGTIQVQFPVQVSAAGTASQDGLITIVQMAKMVADGEDFWADHEGLLDRAKTACHQVFFGILKPETISELEPVY
jgi:uncharacterized protein (TIGR04255 family)